MLNIFDTHPTVRKIRVFLIMVVFIVGFGIIGYMFLSELSFRQSLAETFKTFVFSAPSADTPFIKFFQLSLELVGVILIWWAIWSFFDLLVKGELGEYLKTRSILIKLRKMKDHYIICGGGRVGEELARKIKESGREYIIIEKDLLTVEKLKKKGYFVVQGDVIDDSILKQNNITKAKAVILALPETEKSLLITMASKELAPNVKVYARCENPAYVSKLKKAGAEVVIVPEIAGADKLFDSIF